MTNYIIRRLLLLPVTLFAIILVNFAIINLAPGEPVLLMDTSSLGDASRSTQSGTKSTDLQYLQFREHYGLTLPIFFNYWPSLSEKKIKRAVEELATKRRNGEELGVQEYHSLWILWGDRAQFIMPTLIDLMKNPALDRSVRRTAANVFIRGATKQGYVGPSLSEEKKLFNRKIAKDNALLYTLKIQESESDEAIDQKIESLQKWFDENEPFYSFAPTFTEKIKIFFSKTRFFRYFGRVITLDFGTLRSDSNKTVIREVAKRIKYSLTLAVIPMMITFGVCQAFGMVMALYHNRWPDITFNIIFLILFAIPIFVAAPFLIEKVALHNTFPFSKMPFPFSGFHSVEANYEKLTSVKRFLDVSMHLALPLAAIMYGTLAVQSRISRTAVLEVLKQDYVRTARAKGLPFSSILFKHVGRNAAITIVTSLAASLGVILGGSLIVETIFQINGFGRFFYEAVINRDYNVILFSAFAGSFLTLIGYLAADIFYTFLDPRVSLE